MNRPADAPVAIDEQHLARQRKIRTIGAAVAHPTTGVVGAAFFWVALPHGALVLWAVGLGLTGLALIPEMILADRGQMRPANVIYVTHLYVHAALFAALPWLDPASAGADPTRYMLLIPLFAAAAGYTAVTIEFTDARFRFLQTLTMLGVSYGLAFALAGQWVLLALTALWTSAMGGVSHMGQSYRGELVRLRRESRTAAVQDSLTGLANRSGLLEELDRTISRGRPAALVVVDLDRFKLINDALGHHFGDQVLIVVGNRLVQSLPDDSYVARVGGDEYAAIIPLHVPLAQLQPLLRTALAVVETPIVHQGRDMHVKASAGLTQVGPDSEASEVLAEADVSMYRSKRSDNDRLTTFTASLRDQITQSSQVEQDFRVALAEERVRFWGQPIARTSDLFPTGVELLARWYGPDGSVIGPAEFIPIAEETGLSVELGRVGLRQAATLLAKWSTDPELHHLRVNVNISPRHLGANLLGDVEEALALMGSVAPSALGLEFVEHGLILALGDDLGHLHQLREMGVRLIIDDFGVGYSSLTYLRALPMTNMKLDRSFIQDLDSDHTKRELTAMVAGLSRAIDLPIVAEGVETEAELQVLRDLGMAAVQGYGIARPAPLGKVEQDLRRLRRQAGNHRESELASIEAELRPLNAARPGQEARP